MIRQRQFGANKNHNYIRPNKSDSFDRVSAAAPFVDRVKDGTMPGIDRLASVVVPAQYCDEIRIFREDRCEPLAIAVILCIFQDSDQLINGVIVIRHLFPFPSAREA